MVELVGRPVYLCVGALGAACALLLSTATASAETPFVLTIAGGEGGPMEANGGAGNEQPTVALVTGDGGEAYVVVIYMSSNVEASQFGLLSDKAIYGKYLR